MTEDRLNKSDSALLLNNGYIRIPSGVYFNGDFTFMAWVKFNRRFTSLFVFKHSSRSLNIFCDIQAVNEIVSYEYEYDMNRITYKSYNKTQCTVSTLNTNLIITDTELKLNQWIHLALVFSNNSLRFYLNNTLNGKTSLEMLRNEYFNSNFIGKQGINNLEDYSITYDEIKMFDRSLNEYELRKQTNFHESKQPFN